MLHAPALRALAARVQVRHDAALDARYPRAWPHRITLRLRGGRELHALSEYPPGTAQVPMSAAQVQQKFSSLCEPMLGANRARALHAAVCELETAADLVGLGAILRGA